jgi:hypothetical protein
VIRLRRIIVIALWTVAAFWGWLLLLIAGLRLLVRSQQRYGWQPVAKLLPEWVVWSVFFGLFGVGTIVITVGILMLGMRGRLPGTSRRDCGPAGFPIEPVSESD